MKRKLFTAKRISTLAVFTAMSLIMFLVESLFPPLFLPGAKMVIDSGVTVTANYMAIYESYPTSTDYTGAGTYFKLGSEYVQYEKAYYNIPAELVVNGTLNVNTIGGTVNKSTYPLNLEFGL